MLNLAAAGIGASLLVAAAFLAAGLAAGLAAAGCLLIVVAFLFDLES
jgi:hypothetical protein